MALERPTPLDISNLRVEKRGLPMNVAALAILEPAVLLDASGRLAIGAITVLGMITVFVILAIWAERRFIARLQDRLGPNRVGKFGLLQSVADALKLLAKEIIRPQEADPFLHFLAPTLILGASLNPGAGPRTVNGSLTVGPFYLPPLLVALVCVVVATLVARGVKHSYAVGGGLAAVLLIGSATMGWPAISYRISHPTHPLGFTEDWLQLIGEATAALSAAFAAARHRRGSRSPKPRATPGARAHPTPGV